jgi:hypothetical protein
MSPSRQDREGLQDSPDPAGPDNRTRQPDPTTGPDRGTNSEPVQEQLNSHRWVLAKGWLRRGEPLAELGHVSMRVGQQSVPVVRHEHDRVH